MSVMTEYRALECKLLDLTDEDAEDADAILDKMDEVWDRLPLAEREKLDAEPDRTRPKADPNRKEAKL